jgi:hypothetical protein
MVQKGFPLDFGDRSLVNVVVCAIGDDVEGRLAVNDLDLHRAGGMAVIDLEACRPHAPLGHRLQDLRAVLVIPHPAHQKRVHPERS